MAIKNCKHKGLEELFVYGKTSKIDKRFAKNALLILDHLAAITDIKDCAGVKDFHSLKGERKDTYSMHVNGNYCIIVIPSTNGTVCCVDKTAQR